MFDTVKYLFQGVRLCFSMRLMMTMQHFYNFMLEGSRASG